MEEQQDPRLPERIFWYSDGISVNFLPHQGQVTVTLLGRKFPFADVRLNILPDLPDKILAGIDPCIVLISFPEQRISIVIVEPCPGFMHNFKDYPGIDAKGTLRGCSI